ncbi:MAG: endolytic transglycosylase MltG [Legionellaceae bacterium]|nr:endolytic transglycosylase MltG [Legionellaceae bacterium]
MAKGRLSIVLLSFMLLFLLLATTIVVFYNIFYEPIPIDEGRSTILVIDKNSSAKSIVSELKAKSLIKNDILFLTYLRAFGFAKKLKAGVYEVSSSQTPHMLINNIVSGQVLKRSFQIIEGTTYKQVIENIKKAPYLNFQNMNWELVFSRSEDLLVLCDRSPLDMQNRNRSDSCASKLNFDNIDSNLEGLFLADTYQYNAGGDSLSVLLQSHNNLKKHLLFAWENRSVGLPYKNPYELLVAASIIEKESAIADERRVISGVIVNRLTKNMPLQMDPTVIYGLGDDYTGKLSHADMHKDSEYNTYIHKGLPPTPITIVGKKAIDAASHPDKTKYLYFVAKGDGSHIFSNTYAEQKHAIKRYLGNTDGH